MKTENISLRSKGLQLYSNKPSGLHVCLHSCHLQTIQPTVSWFQIFEISLKKFAALIENHQNVSSEENLAIFELLGLPFMVTYLPNFKVDLSTNPRPSLQSLQEIQKWLWHQLHTVCKESLFVGHSFWNADDKTCDEIQILRRSIGSVVQNNLNLFLLKNEEEKFKNKIQNGKNYFKLFLGNEGSEIQCFKRNQKSIKQATSIKKALLDDDDDDNNDDDDDDIVIKEEMSSNQSECLGKILKNLLLNHSSSKTMTMASALSGYRLPNSLRRFWWKEVLFQSQKHLLKKRNIEKYLRLEFGESIMKNCEELRISNATKSAMNSLLENSVIETYSKTKSLQKYATNSHLKEASRVLNVLYVYDKTYQPSLIYWLMVLQLSFSIQTKDPLKIGEHVYDLAMYLFLVRKSCFPNRLNVLKNSWKVLEILKEQDPLLYDHLQQIARINIQEDPKEFLVTDFGINEERKKIEKNLFEEKNCDSFSMERLAPNDPMFFIYKWIQEGFVSVLDPAAIFWVWDQCFLQHWDPKVLCDLSLALLLLLRSNFLNATDNLEMRKVFLNDPCQLFTKEIQKTWIQIQKKKTLPDIERNTQRLCQSNEKRNLDVSLILERISASKSMTSFILKDLHLKLEFLPNFIKKSKGTFLKVPWTKKPNMEKIVIKICSKFGQTTIAIKEITAPYSNLKTKADIAGRLIAVFSVDGIFQFESYDTIQFASEVKQGGYPYVMISVHYKEGNNDVPLGWSWIDLLDLFTWNQQKWSDMEEKENFYPIHPGLIPLEFKEQSFMADEDFIQYFLGYNSELLLSLNIKRLSEKEVKQRN